MVYMGDSLNLMARLESTQWAVWPKRKMDLPFMPFGSSPSTPDEGLSVSERRLAVKSPAANMGSAETKEGVLKLGGIFCVI